MERRAIVVHGIVQGVGFRPFVYNLASRLQLHGSVKNQTGSVLIEVEGEASTLDQFLEELTDNPPPLAHIDRLAWQTRPPLGEGQFRIQPSDSDSTSEVFISRDVATCPQCLSELLDPRNHRYRYAFLNCTNCGPRLTIITGAPYDRPRTTMAAFRMCARCQREYDDPGDRRFHAQPTACRACGPQLQLLDCQGKQVEVTDALAAFAEAMREGKIGALKGLGGYHLACAAENSVAVAQLRRRKHRDEKPFAIMVADIADAAKLAEIDATERELLLSSRRPIVLLRKRIGNGIAEDVAPRNPFLGIMLPYTPLHHLLLQETRMPLVMTSGNRSDEPIAFREEEAFEKLTGIADLFLVHDRPIHVRCDDSVTRVMEGLELPVRRSRGYAPEPIPLPFDCPVDILAVGGQLKATFALGRYRNVFLSHHLGDLDHYEAYLAFLNDLTLYRKLFAITPEAVAHDLHPDYASTRYASDAACDGEKLVGVQHHHAHMASCMAEHGLTEPVIGVTFDGTGFGLDGAVWGGEFLVGDYRQFRRAARLRYVGMPGGDQAIRQPWRMAVAHLADAGLACRTLTARLLPVELGAVRRMLERGFNSPLTSSVGRLFDAIAALLGVRDSVNYEGQAAIELEWLATGVPAEGGYGFDVSHAAPPDSAGWPLVVDTRPLVRAVTNDMSKGVESAVIARRFHQTLVDMIAVVCGQIRCTSGVDSVVLSGGVFLNALLTKETNARLKREGFQVYRHRLVPPNDGGLSLGQVAVAAALLSS
jgi:hydrogenase maturation protein HypF